MGAGMRYQPQGRAKIDSALGIKFLINPAFGTRDLTGSTTYDGTSGGGASQSGARSGVARQYNAATDFFGEKVSLAPMTAYSVLMVVDVPTMKDWTGLFARELYGTNSFKILQQEGSGPEMRITEQGGNYVRADSGAAAKLYGVGPVCVVVVWDGTSAYLYIAGRKCGDAALSTAPQNSTSARLKVFGISDSENVTGKLFLCAYSPNVAWSRGKARELSANPWAIFAEADDDDLYAAAVPANATGTLSSTLGPATMSAAGFLSDSGAFASTLAGASMSATGSVATLTPVSGAFASTLGSAAMSAAGATTDVGTFAATMAGVSMAANGGVAAVPYGTFAATLAGAGMSAAGSVLNRGALSALMAGASMSATGTAAPHATGAFASTMQGAAMFANGYLGNVAPANPVRAYRWRIMRRHFSNPGTQ